jgi:hypothetical protein
MFHNRSELLGLLLFDAEFKLTCVYMSPAGGAHTEVFCDSQDRVVDRYHIM